MSVADAASSLGTVADIWVLIALIIPGFITFRIIIWLVAYELNLDQFTTTIYSLVCSLIIFVPISFIYGFESLSTIRSYIVEPETILSIFGFAILFGIIPGIILRYTIRVKFRFGSAWDGFAEGFLSRSVVVYTNDNKEYVGWIKRISVGKDNKKELSLGHPHIVKRESTGVKLLPLGDELFITEANICRILRKSP